MPDRPVLQEMELVLDEVFGERDRVALRDVYARASAHVNLPAGMLAHLNEIPEGAYTRADIAEAINEVIRRRGEQDTLGLLDVPARIEPVEETAQAERAVQDDTPLDALAPESPSPRQEPPEFREPGSTPPG